MRKGWVTAKLGELCSIQLGGTPARKIPRYWDPQKKSKNVWLSIAGMPKSVGEEIFDSKEYLSDDGAKKVKLVKKGTLLFSFKLSIGRICFAGKDIRTNEAIAALSIENEKLIGKRYLSWFLAGQDWEVIAAHDDKLLGKTLNKAKLKEIPVIVPPLTEQKRIVAVLDKAFEGIAVALANAEQNLANARELFETTLNATFTQKGEGWVEYTLKDVVEENCSLSYGIVQPGIDFPNGLPVVRPTDLKSKLIEVSGLKLIDPSLAKSYLRTKLLGNELLLCVRGSTGTVSVAAKELAGANVTRGIVPIRFDEKTIDQTFGYYQLIAKVFQDQIREGTYGAALMQINIRDLKKISVFAPPVVVQKNIVKKLDVLSTQTQRLEAIYQQKVDDIIELKQSLLQRAFAGELVADVANATVTEAVA